MENVRTAADALMRLEEPFASKDVKWRVAATSRDDHKGRVTPYASTPPTKVKLTDSAPKGHNGDGECAPEDGAA